MNLVVYETLAMNKDTAIIRKLFLKKIPENFKSVIEKFINHFANFRNS